MSTFDVNNYLPYTVYIDGEVEYDGPEDYTPYIKKFELDIKNLEDKYDERSVLEREILMDIIDLLTTFEDDDK